MKILLGMHPVGGHLAGIKYGLDALGVEADLIYYKNNKFDMPNDKIVWKDNTSRIEKVTSMYRFFNNAMDKYDVIHFSFGRSFFSLPRGMDFFDLPFISNEKKIFVTFNGCDIRQKDKMSKIDPLSACADKECGKTICGGWHDRVKAMKVRAFTKKARQTYVTTPDLKLFSPNSKLLMQPKHTFYNYDFIGINTNKKKLKVIHAPTDTDIKGTVEVIAACNKLESSIELILVQNMTNEEAIEAYKNADLIIDQLKVGWYGGFAVEAMRMGKPIIAYIRECDLKYITSVMRKDLPIINANRNSIEDVLQKVVYNREVLKDLSEKSYAYANKYHDPIKIAKELYEDYKNG